MSDAVCFRCDWHGSVEGDACPRCGANVYRATDQAERVETPSTSSTASLPPPPEPPTLPEHPVVLVEPVAGPADARRSRPGSVLAGLAVVTVVVAMLVSRAGRDPAERTGRGTHLRPPQLHGTLVFASFTGAQHGRQHLWRYALDSGRILEGPTIPQTLQLLTSRALPSKVVFATERGDGSQAAVLVAPRRPAVRAVTFARGDVLAWDPNADSVVVAERGPLNRSPCGRDLRLRRLEVGTGDPLVEFRERDLCGDYVAVGADGSRTYFTRVTGAGLGIYAAGVHGADSVLPGYALVSVSPVGHMLVARPPVRIGPPRAGAPGSRVPSSVFGTVLFWSGHGRPAPFGTPGADLRVERVLAWSPDGAQALVVGDLDRGRAVYLLDAGPGPERREPAFVRELDRGGPVGATFDDRGVAFIAISGDVLVFAEGELSELGGLPAQPRPAGPITWLP